MKDIILELGKKELKRIMDCLGCPFLILDNSVKLLYNNKSFKDCGYTLSSIIPNDTEFKNIRKKIERQVEVEREGRTEKITIKINPVKISTSSENIFLVELCSQKKPLSGVIESWYKTIDALSEMVYVVDEDYNLVKLNNAAALLSGNHPKDLIGKKCYKAVFGKEEACKSCILPEIIASVRKEKLQTIRREWDRPFLVSAVKIKKGEYLFIMEDVTKIEQLERNIAEIRRFTSIGGIISHIRHDVGNAVNAIKCSLQVFEHMYDDIDDEERKEYLKSSLVEIKRMESLLFTLREFSRYEGIGSFELNLTDLILDSKDKFNKYCKDKGVDCKFKCEKREFTMKGDKLSIVVALTKIIDNSLEAMEDSQKKKLMFKYSVDEHEATIEITDTGRGISENDLPKVAEPFFTTKRNRAGLGLYHASKIIKTQGGDFTFSTKEGKGTTVKITFRK
ncbi:PAS domain-containing sensor histidine kinase [candidate division WOR-3 bacterium]|nr:PAS domain-containing sensor histidine kinase [candidate division WOR-3 bacterium]